MCFDVINYIYKKNVALNDIQWSICHQTKPNPTYLVRLYKKDLPLNDIHCLYLIKPKLTKSYIFDIYV